MKVSLLPLLILALYSCAAFQTLPAQEREQFPAIKLRAYGELSGEALPASGDPQGSTLRITCESEPKAQLLLAKYLSDLGLLSGVTPLPLKTARGPLAARQVEGQGTIAAARIGSQVWIFTASDGPGLTALYESAVPAGTKVDATEAEIPVPMYLDRWDKNGFRFYYGPFKKPQGPDHRDIKVYDPRQDFAFAKQSGDAGLICWYSPDTDLTAEGITDIHRWEWVLKQAQLLKLPFGINDGLGDRNPSLANRYPEQMAPIGNEYLGGWYGVLNFGGVTPAWSAAEVQDVALSQMQPSIRDLSHYDNIVNWLEPHEEMGHGNADLLDDSGPTARTSFQGFLQSKYGTIDAVSQRWFGKPGSFKSWSDVELPELATFFGWGPDALDLTGLWKINFDAPYGIDSAAPALDDSAWLDMQAPGHAIARFIPRKPAVFRRHFKVVPAWHAAHAKAWLCVWDFNDTRPNRNDPTANTDVLVFLNGQAVPENPPIRMDSHWVELEISSQLADGDNVLTICLPKAIFSYRVYITGQPPATYPQLTPELNAKWADFTDWLAWSRGQAVRRGAQMIRQVDPDRPITLMSPDSYLSPIKDVAEDYGGIFHNTGYMAGFWADRLTLQAASAGLPTDAEPGSGASDVPDFKRFMGRWLTEGVQGVDYFQHIGDIMWNDGIRDYFQQTLKLWHLIGKYHLPKSELALLDSDRNSRLFGFPWNTGGDGSSAPDLILRSGYWGWRLADQLVNEYPRESIIEDDFARGNADPYKIIIDTNTTIMDPEIVADIQKWVSKGGIFVTFQQTGRHTSTTANAWPISQLTGYAVTGIDPLNERGEGVKKRHLHLADGQTVFHSDGDDWKYIGNSAGLSLQKQDPDCQDLLVWDDGSVAAGLRKIGQGMVIDLGCNSQGLLWQVLAWAKIKRVPAIASDKAILTRHYVSNNGLYDIWMLFNQNGSPVTADLNFREGFHPASCRDVNTDEIIPVDGDASAAKLSHLAFDSWQTRAFISPRGLIAQAPVDWFKLQRSWWRGTLDPGAPIPPYTSRLADNLTDDWAFKAVDGDLTGPPPEDPSLADPSLDDSSWKRMDLGIFDIPDNQDIHHAIFRKRFTVPAEWNHGKVLISAHSDYFQGGRFYLDGKVLHPTNADDDAGGTLTAGSTHTAAVEIWGQDHPLGIRTPVWLSYRPDPVSQQQLPDNWSFAPDLLTYGPPFSLSTPIPSGGALRTIVKIGAEHSAYNVIVHTLCDTQATRGVIFNGHWIERGGNIYRAFDLNVTPWVKFGQDNEIIVLCNGKAKVQEASLDYYDKAVYP